MHESQISGSNCFSFHYYVREVDDCFKCSRFSPGDRGQGEVVEAIKLNQVKATWILIGRWPNILILSGFHQTLIRLLGHKYWFCEHKFLSFPPQLHVHRTYAVMQMLWCGFHVCKLIYLPLLVKCFPFGKRSQATSKKALDLCWNTSTSIIPRQTLRSVKKAQHFMACTSFNNAFETNTTTGNVKPTTIVWTSRVVSLISGCHYMPRMCR